MNIENVVGEVEKIIAPHINEMNLELVDVEYIQDGAYFYLRIYIEKIDGEVSLEDCASFSNLIEEKVDALIEDKFFLEVSSPGLERPLKKEKDFERFVGKKIKIISKNKIQLRGKNLKTNDLQFLQQWHFYKTSRESHHNLQMES